jgi:hypothetical protein
MKRSILILAVLSLWLADSPSFSQIGGTSVYQVLNLPPGARSAALGGYLPAARDQDPALAYHNPALVSPLMNNRFSLNYSNYISDIQYGYLAGSHDFGRWGSAAAGIQFIHYGEFLEANEFGDILGTFSAAEYTLNLGYAYPIDSLISVGVTVRPVYSVLERYVSWGLSSDFGLHYHNPDNRLALSLVARNLGLQLSTYATPEREPLPFDLLAGISYKLKHAPFRLHLTARNLQQFDLRGRSGDIDSNAGFLKKTENFVGTSLDHLVAGVEFVPGDLIALRIGYNFLRRAELGMDQGSGATGFSFGAGLNLGWLSLDYALASYHLAAMTHTLSVRIGI